ncbi:caspase family protein [Plectonema cf. radiosum LEGE 06105]|uniref:Caspase family protein n=1 Tax=Plectonema cf. radiosum LEGE 06105 TaxID=945769 RepID=A0A8J7K419_9CYAN|nr:caspase family protein [Plectonema radiosum]MBE9215872.1 caspase family protein [Plectonema cf. radiosum LEGE 06105]
MPNIYALLVGINEYHPQSGVTSLTGCVNDIEAIESYLHNRITTDNDCKLVTKKLTNNLATRQGIIDGFSQHLSQARSEDVVLFYYAGHGSYEPAPEVFLKQERDGKIETLVCYDSRTSGVRDLADKELNYLIEQVAKNNPHILIILDSCHSGTATREPDVIERQTNTDGNVRDLKDFLFDQEWVNRRLSAGYQRPRHVLISACRDFQTAKETGLNNQRRGAFSYFLTEALERTNGSLSYANLVQDINALITGKVKDQSPQIEAQSDDLIQPFLGGAAGERINYFSLIYDEKNHRNWVINGGLLHGIRPEGKTSLAIFAQGTTLEDLQKIDTAICKAEVTQVMTEASKVQLFDEKIKLSQQEAYWAVVSDVPLPNLKVFFTGDDAGKAIALEVFKQGDNKFVAQADSEEKADYYLEAIEGQFWIKQPSDKKPLVAPVPEVRNTQGYTAKDAETIIKRLEHIARWKNILELKTPPTSQIKVGDVEMELIVTSENNSFSSKQGISPLIAEYIFENNQFSNPEVKIKVINNSDKDVYFQVLELAGDYEIQVAEFFEERGSIKLPAKPNQGESIAEGDQLECFIPDNYLNNGIRNYDNIYKLIVSNREFDASLLQQPGLDNPPPVNRSTNLSGTLNRLMDGVYTRQSKRKIDKYIDNWMTQEVKVTLIKPPGGVEIKQSESTNLLPGVELQSHPNLKGKFSINPLPPSSRDVNSNLIPPILLPEQTVLLRDGKRQPEPYNFNMTRGGGGNLSILEIVDIENHESVTPENPIKLLVGKPLAPDEYILPVANDGEFFLPLGKAKTINDKTEITLERLPEPTVDSRSLQGSIKILFQKVFYESAGKQLGMNSPCPLLRITNVSESGRVTYNGNDQEIKTKVASANKILLYIHGIIGDTESLLPSIKSAKFVEAGIEKNLEDKYDLILAFDYENINTTIQENAKLLKQRLESVGISANHGKQLDIVAHSMGGLVSRTFIEVEGGNQIVQHLVMLGTPNAGSPWPKIQDWAFTALGIGLNQLSTVAWGTNVIAGLLAFLEANDKASEQMKYQSDFIQSIAKNPDPNVQYTIIAGDRTIRPEALEVVGGNSSKIQRMMGKLFGSAVDNVVDKVFFQQPNDIAVTLESIKSVSLERNPQPRIISPVGCDHLTYFTSQAGLDALVKALGDK